MKRFLTLTVCCIAMIAAAAQTAGTKPTGLLSFFKTIAEYDSKYSQEKVYLHLDNNGYFMDETIWFKAYIVRASTLKPTDLSKVLYVELRDANGQLIERKNYEITDGQAEGSLSLEDLMHSGFYEVRAYTRAMLNWDGNYTFSRVVPIYETNDTTGNYINPFMYKVEGINALPSSRADVAPLHSDSVQHKGIYVDFYPEGGTRVSGLMQQIAYKATERNGKGAKTTCKVYDASGKIISTSKPEHDGMGSFLIPAGQSDNIRVTFTDETNKENDFKLPAAHKSGIAARASSEGDSILLNLQSTADLVGKAIGMSITCRGAACHFDTIRLKAKQNLSINTRLLHYGINQITLFNDQGNIMWERLIWKTPNWPVSLNLKQDAKIYQPFAPIVLDMKLADAKGNPCNAYFSISVRDAATLTPGKDMSADADLLLSSDLKGYIANPEYYFESDDIEHQRALDLLLLVQGWRRYDWKEMAEIKPFKLLQPIEEGQLIMGSILSDDHKRLPMKGVKLDVNIFFPGLKVSGSCVTNDGGTFALMPPKYYSEGVGRFSTFSNGQAKNMRVTLDRDFSPALKTFDPQEIDPSCLQTPKVTEPKTDEVFMWKDTISKGDIQLGEAVVRAKRKDDFSHGRYSWEGGESFGRRNCDIYYNMKYELMRYCDKGEDEPLLWDLLRDLNKNFDYFTDDTTTSAGVNYKFTYKNMPVVVYQDNVLMDAAGHMDNYVIFASEVRSVYICTNQEQMQKLTHSTDTSPKYGIFLYGEGEPELLKYKKKTHIVHFFGYNQDEEFQGPDYRKQEMPDKNDFRRTLYWNPDVLADKDGKASILFYSNARPDVKLKITARAVLPDGSLLDYER